MIPAVMNSHVSETRAAVTELVRVFYRAVQCGQEHAWLATLPGVIAAYFTDDQGQPRADLDITQAQFEAAIVGVMTIRETINAGSIGADLTRIKV